MGEDQDSFATDMLEEKMKKKGIFLFEFKRPQMGTFCNLAINSILLSVSSINTNSGLW